MRIELLMDFIISAVGAYIVAYFLAGTFGISSLSLLVSLIVVIDYFSFNNL